MNRRSFLKSMFGLAALVGLGGSQAVRHLTVNQASAGSNPALPATRRYPYPPYGLVPISTKPLIVMKDGTGDVYQSINRLERYKGNLIHSITATDVFESQKRLQKRLNAEVHKIFEDLA